MQKGFTLIEILIVVAIIAILASVVLVGLGPTQQSGRDARRISDLSQVQNGLELYYSKCGYYPGQIQSGATCTAWTSFSGTWSTFQGILTGSALGVSNVPSDPNANTPYVYASQNGTSYVLRASLENQSNQALNNDLDGTQQGTVNCADTPAPAQYCTGL